MSSVCSVCVESFNKSNRILIKCMCGFECCRECYRDYLITVKEDPACMSCKVKWSMDFMVENLGKTFMTKNYREYREELLVEREMGFLKETQSYVAREILEDKKIKLREEYKKNLEAINKEITELLYMGNDKMKMYRKCPKNDCHGFLTEEFRCELCGCSACSECREEKNTGHKCNKQILESIKTLDKDSKPCPKCATLIFKTEGCDQMYCTKCHTPFSWRTLRIEHGTIHNPHYFEHQRRINNGMVPRNPRDIQCGREINWDFMMSLKDKHNPLPKGWKREDKNGRIKYYSPKGLPVNPPVFDRDLEEVLGICGEVIKIRIIDLDRFAVQEGFMKNLKPRMDYMRNKITRDEFKKLLQKKDKDDSKKTEINNVLGMYIQCMTDIFYRLMENGRVADMKKEMNELRLYTNECFNKIGNTYNCKKYNINETYKLL